MGGVVTEVGTSFLDVARQYDKERESTDDTNGLFECNKYGVCLFILYLAMCPYMFTPFSRGPSTSSLNLS